MTLDQGGDAIRYWMATGEDPSPPPDDYGGEPLGSCVIHGDYWTVDCQRCDWTAAAHDDNQHSDAR